MCKKTILEELYPITTLLYQVPGAGMQYESFWDTCIIPWCLCSGTSDKNTSARNCLSNRREWSIESGIQGKKSLVVFS